MEQSKKEIQNLKQPADKQNVSNSDTAVSKKKHSHAGHRERMRLRFQNTRFWNCCYSMLCRE